jgi:hypothetical protein
VTRHDKLIDRIVRGNADAGIRFQDLVSALNRLGFEMRVKGDHHIFTKEGVAEILNLQPRDGKAKPYQVKQVRAVITAYGLARRDDEKENME